MDIDKLILTAKSIKTVDSFGSLMDIDKLIPAAICMCGRLSFGSLMDIDKLIQFGGEIITISCFGSLMDIDNPTKHTAPLPFGKGAAFDIFFFRNRLRCGGRG